MVDAAVAAAIADGKKIAAEVKKTEPLAELVAPETGDPKLYKPKIEALPQKSLKSVEKIATSNLRNANFDPAASVTDPSAPKQVTDAPFKQETSPLGSQDNAATTLSAGSVSSLALFIPALAYLLF